MVNSNNKFEFVCSSTVWKVFLGWGGGGGVGIRFKGMHCILDMWPKQLFINIRDLVERAYLNFMATAIELI